MTESTTTCPLCRKPIKPDAEFRACEVLNRGVPEPAVAHAKCLERHEREMSRFMKKAEKQKRQC